MVTSQKISLPWGAWYANSTKYLELPKEYVLDYYELQKSKIISFKEIREKLYKLKELLLSTKDIKTVTIVVDDLTRPVFLGDLLKILINELQKFEIRRSDIKILIGLGAHRPLTEEDIAKKLSPEIAQSFKWINHSVQDTIDTGITWGETPIKINRYYLESDFKIVISGLTPHSFAGFSGGAKMLIPGIADLGIISKTHKSVLMGFMGQLGKVEGNRFRKVIENLVKKIGIDFFIGIIINGDRTIADIVAGNFIDAHREAGYKARQFYSTALKDNAPYDLLILNAYPKDTELLQAENALIPIKSSSHELLKEEGLVLVTSACSEGLGYHGLFGPKGVLYRKPKPLRFLNKRLLLFFSPNITEDQFKQIFYDNYLFFDDKISLQNYLTKNLPKKARVGIFPYASLQLVE